MSRKKKRNRANQKARQGQQAAAAAKKVETKPKQSNTRRYIIPLGEWKRFERFKDRLVHIEEALTDLQENWANHVGNMTAAFGLFDSDFETMNDNIVRLSDLVRGVEGNSARKGKRKVYHDTPAGPVESVGPRLKRKNGPPMMAEIIIEDISDGKL